MCGIVKAFILAFKVYNGYMSIALSPPAQAVIQATYDAARGLQISFVGAEHILLGLLAVPGNARNHLEEHDINYKQVQGEIQRVYGEYRHESPETLPMTPRVERILETAEEVAQQASCQTVSDEHILQALLQEDGGVAVSILDHSGILQK